MVVVSLLKLAKKPVYVQFPLSLVLSVHVCGIRVGILVLLCAFEWIIPKNTCYLPQNPLVVCYLRVLPNLLCKLFSFIHRLFSFTVEVCSPLPFIPNGSITYGPDMRTADFDVGAIATYTCNDGYRLSGFETRECEVGGL